MSPPSSPPPQQREESRERAAPSAACRNSCCSAQPQQQPLVTPTWSKAWASGPAHSWLWGGGWQRAFAQQGLRTTEEEEAAPPAISNRSRGLFPAGFPPLLRGVRLPSPEGLLASVGFQWSFSGMPWLPTCLGLVIAEDSVAVCRLPRATWLLQCLPPSAAVLPPAFSLQQPPAPCHRAPAASGAEFSLRMPTAAVLCPQAGRSGSSEQVLHFLSSLP